MNIKSFSKFGIKLIISVILLYFIVKDVAFDDILASIKSADYLTLVFAFSLHGVGLTISAIRWQGLLKSQNIDSKFWYLLKSYLVATFFNHFMPSTVGGDSVRTYDSWKLGENKAKALAVVVVDRFMGLVALLIFVIISTFYSNEFLNRIPNLWLWILLLTVGAIFIIMFLLIPPLELFKKIKESKNKIVGKLGSILFKFGDACSQFRNDKSALVRGMVLSFILQANVVLYYYVISHALGIEVPIYAFFLIVPLTIFIMMLPISVNGIGLRENSLFFFLSFWGVLKSQAIAMAWIDYGMLLILGIIGGIVYAFRK